MNTLPRYEDKNMRSWLLNKIAMEFLSFPFFSVHCLPLYAIRDEEIQAKRDKCYAKGTAMGPSYNNNTPDEAMPY
jgi:hypothetical protein